LRKIRVRRMPARPLILAHFMPILPPHLGVALHDACPHGIEAAGSQGSDGVPTRSLDLAHPISPPLNVDGRLGLAGANPSLPFNHGHGGLGINGKARMLDLSGLLPELDRGHTNSLLSEC